MNYKHIVLVLVGIFFLGACSDVKENISWEENITSGQIESAKKEIFLENISGLKRVKKEDFKKELLHSENIVIDVRTIQELEQTGVISWAKNIDFYNSDFQSNLDLLDKSKKYLIYCRSGNRSSQTLKIMKDLWFQNVLELEWWMSAWLRAWEVTEPFDQNIEEEKVISISAKKWEFSQKIIEAKKWEKLIIKVENSDTLHGIAIPEMQLVWDTEIQVDTSQVWEFEFRCANYCGEGHQDMVGKIIIK